MTARRLRPLALAMLFTGTAGAAHAADLMQAYELARESDPQLQAADAQRLQQGEGPVQARAALLPQVNGSIDFQDSKSAGEQTEVISRDPLIVDSGVGFGDSRSRDSGLRLTQSIYDHRNWTRLRAARTRAEQFTAVYDAANDALVTRVAEAYFNVLTAIDSLAFARAEARAVQRQLDQANQRFEVGLTAITDVHEARARYDNSRANAITAEVQLDDAREALREITGQYMENLRGLDESFEPVSPEPADISKWVELALENNPTLHSRELASVAASQDIATARAGHYPYLSGSVSYGDQASWGSDRSRGVTLPSGSEGYGTTIGLSLTIPIFSGGLTQSQVRQAIYTRDIADDQLEQERRAITRQTRNAYRALVAGLTEIEARKQALVSAQSAMEATEAGFEVGTRTIVDVLISQQVLFQAQRDYSISRHNFLVNTLRLRQAAGTVEAKDVAAVNAFLVADAESKLDNPEQATEEMAEDAAREEGREDEVGND